MEPTVIPAAVFLIVLIVSALTKLHAVILGQPVTVPALWLVLAAVVLALVIMLLVMIRLMVRDGLRLRPVAVVRA